MLDKNEEKIKKETKLIQTPAHTLTKTLWVIYDFPVHFLGIFSEIWCTKAFKIILMNYSTTCLTVIYLKAKRIPHQQS